MEKRPLTQSMRQWLLDEVERWRAQQLVTEDQANAILDLYETPRQSAARQQSIAIYVLVGVAAMFVGLAVFLLIGYNWAALPDPIKLGVLLTAIGGMYGFAFALRYHWKARIFSEFAFFLGSLFYGGAMGLIADIFHLHAHPPDGLWYWALGVIPLALFLDTVLLHLLAVTLLSVWVGTEMLGFQHREDLALLGWLPRVCFTLPIFAGLGLLWAYQKRSAITVGLYVPLIGWWLILLPFAFHARENPIFFIGGVGALLLILAEIHVEGSRFAIPYRLYGTLACVIVLSILSFHGVQRDLARIQDVRLFVVQSALLAALSAAVFGVAFFVQSQRESLSYSYLRPMYAFAVRQWLPLAMAGLMLFMTIWYAALKDVGAERDSIVALVPTVLANVGMLVLAFWLMMNGLREDRGFPSAGGVLFFLLWSILRYAEWFGNRGELLGASCMFFFCGAAIFAFAMFWHQRRKSRERKSDERDERDERDRSSDEWSET